MRDYLETVITRASLIPIAAFALAGCRTIPTKVVDVRIVPRSEQSFDDSDWGSRPGRLLRVELHPRRKIREYVQKNDLESVYFQAWWCGDKHRRLDYLGDVYDDGGVIRNHFAAPAGEDVWVYIVEFSAERRNVDQELMAAYDLRISKEDVCVQLNGRTMGFGWFQSNVLRIPARRIADLLSDAD